MADIFERGVDPAILFSLQTFVGRLRAYPLSHEKSRETTPPVLVHAFLICNSHRSNVVSFTILKVKQTRQMKNKLFSSFRWDRNLNELNLIILHKKLCVALLQSGWELGEDGPRLGPT